MDGRSARPHREGALPVSVPLSVLDVATVGSGVAASDVLRGTVEMARLAERLGYVRYWFAEHHGMPSIASSAPEVLIAHVAALTERIRVGAGGIMLPNHAPLAVAEAFHTLEALHPGRIDLGLGRAPGTDPATSRALRPFDAEHFPQQIEELLGMSRGDLPEGHPFRGVRVVPTDVALPPVWLLGSSGASARLAGLLGLGYSFARHFSPTPPEPAIEMYRASFRPSRDFPEPHAVLAVSVVCAESRELAEHHAASMDLVWVRLMRGELAPLPTPEEALAYPYTERERAIARGQRALSIVGAPDEVAERLDELARTARADELMVTTNVHSRAARLRSYELVAEALAVH
jgi:luciferase family oxidoreductase group 1